MYTRDSGGWGAVGFDSSEPCSKLKLKHTINTNHSDTHACMEVMDKDCAVGASSQLDYAYANWLHEANLITFRNPIGLR